MQALYMEFYPCTAKHIFGILYECLESHANISPMHVGIASLTASTENQAI